MLLFSDYRLVLIAFVMLQENGIYAGELLFKEDFFVEWDRRDWSL